MPNPAARATCSFCTHDIADVGLLFRSAIGGEPASICDRCVEERMAFIELNRKSPELLAALLETGRVLLAKRWRDAHPGNGEAAL
jgi:hypothetical protein